MRIAPTVALLAALIPLNGCSRNNKVEERAPMPFAAGVIPVPNMDPFIAIPIKPAQEVESFFQLKRDPEKGFIYIQAEKSTRGIVNHLVRRHGLTTEQALDEIKAIDRIVEEFNKEVSSLKQVEINIKSLRADKKPLTPKELESIIDNPPMIGPDRMPHPVTQLPILVPSTRDYINSIQGLRELTLSDGITFKLSVLPSAMDIMTAHGFPFPLHLSDGMSVVPNSEKMVEYFDRRNGSIQRAPYLEVSEEKGQFGPGGINGLIFSGPTAVFTKDTVYFIGFDTLTIDKEKHDPKAIPKRDLLIPELFDDGKLITVSRQIY